MNKEEILRKRNLELVNENKHLKEQIEESVQVTKYHKEMVKQNDELRSELLVAIHDAYAMRDKYQKLLKEMKDFQKSLKGRNAIERFLFKIKRK